MSELSNTGVSGVVAATPAQNRWAIVAVMLAVALATLDTAIANTALPAIAADLHATPAQSVWIALSAMTAVGAFAAQGLALVSLPFYFEDVLHRSQIETGLLITPWPVVVALVAPVAGRLSDRYPPGLLGAIGLACLCAGLASLALLPEHATVFAIALRMSICGVGFGFFQSPNLKALMASAPPTRSGGASGVIATSRLLGQSTGAALVALSFSLAGHHGATYALASGAVFAGVSTVTSGLRLLEQSHRQRNI